MRRTSVLRVSLSIALGLCAWMHVYAQPVAAAKDPAAEEDAAALVERARSVVAWMLREQPNYTCVMTMERTRREPGDKRYTLLDRLRLEVAYVGGKELFSWPGEAHFEAQHPGMLAGGAGVTGTGDFGMHLEHTYLGSTPLHFDGRVTLDGRPALKFSQRVDRARSRYEVAVDKQRGLVGYEAVAWHAADTFELLRFELHVDELPAGLKVRLTDKLIEYRSVQVGGHAFRLPAQTDLSMTHIDGRENRTLTRFSNCHEFTGESTISFEDPAPSAQTRQAMENAVVPAGLRVSSQLDEELDLSKAARGDMVTWTVTAVKGKVQSSVLAPGAKLRARIIHLACYAAQFGYCFALLKPESFTLENRRGEFRAELELPSFERSLTVGKQGMEGAYIVGVPSQVMNAPADVAQLFVRMVTKLPRGYQFVWRTLEALGSPAP